MKEETWTVIPGFENYEVSSTGRVRRLNGTLVRYYQGKGCALVRDNAQFTIRPPRLMYAALHQVDPTKLKGIIVIEKEGELVPMTKSEYTQSMNSKRRNSNLGEKRVKEYYQSAIEFSQMMLRFYDTRDMTEISTDLLKYKKAIANYVYRNGFAMSSQTIEEAWDTVLFNILTKIHEGRISIIEPYSYMRKCIRNYFATLKRERSALVTFSDEGYMYNK